MHRGSVAGRPWGPLGWLAQRAPQWSVICCLSPEERWATVVEQLVEQDRVDWLTLIEIGASGLGSQRVAAEAQLSARRTQALDRLGKVGEAHELFERHDQMAESIRRFIGSAGANILIDISCFPKRFFFPIIKLVTETASAASNIVVAYTHAEHYPAGHLSENPEPASSLPMFMGALAGIVSGTLIVAVGAEPLGLAQIVDAGGSFDAIKVLYPFPAPPPLGRRNWEFLQLLSKARHLDREDVIGIDPSDVPRIFERLLRLGGVAAERLTLAPYGPKPVSLAMCLFALAQPAERRPDVVYTQPKSYNPMYSAGVAMRQGQPWVTGYALKLDGESLYRVA